MLLLDIDHQQLAQPLVIAAVSETSQSHNGDLYGVVGICSPVFQSVYTDLGVSRSREVIVAPGDEARGIFLHRHQYDHYEAFANSELGDETLNPKSLVIVDQSKHGQLIPDENNGGVSTYKADEGYKGPDQISFIVELAGHRIKVIHYIKVTDEKVKPTNSKEEWDKVWKKYCSHGTDTWLISNLPGNTLAQTTDIGLNATITLGTNTAGYGWFVNNTPSLTDEFLPTSNPYEWIAKVSITGLVFPVSGR